MSTYNAKMLQLLVDTIKYDKNKYYTVHPKTCNLSYSQIC